MIPALVAGLVLGGVYALLAGGLTIGYTASVQERSEDGGRRWVTVLTVAHQDGQQIAAISSRLGWPS